MTSPTDPPAASPPPPRYFWEDFPVGQVREFGSYRVTREAVLAFAREFDPQPFHLLHALDRDQSLLAGLDLEPGQTAERRKRLGGWKRGAY